MRRKDVGPSDAAEQHCSRLGACASEKTTARRNTDKGRAAPAAGWAFRSESKESRARLKRANDGRGMTSLPPGPCTHECFREARACGADAAGRVAAVTRGINAVMVPITGSYVSNSTQSKPQLSRSLVVNETYRAV